MEFEATLKRITDKVRDSLDEDQILQTAVEELGQTLGVLGCDTGIYNAEQTTVTVCNEYFPSMTSVKGEVLQLLEAPEIHTALQNGQGVQFCYLVPHPLRQIEEQMAVLACPVMDTQNLIGDLWLFKPREQSFSELENRLAQQVANQCAIAIRQARLYQTSQAQIQELEKLNRLKDGFLSTISHELHMPISNMKLAIHMLKVAPTPDIAPQPLRERYSRYLDILQAECDKEATLINDLLDLQRLENQGYDLQPTAITLKTWLPSLLDSFSVRAQQRQQILQVEIPDGLRAIGSDCNSLGRVLAELLTNACKYTPTGGKICLAIEQHGRDPAIAQFIVMNQAEIPKAELLRIFEKFYRVSHADPWKQSGTGLQSGNGETTFTVLLPNWVV